MIAPHARSETRTVAASAFGALRNQAFFSSLATTGILALRSATRSPRTLPPHSNFSINPDRSATFNPQASSKSPFLWVDCAAQRSG
jgi:hypothetical protein